MPSLGAYGGMLFVFLLGTAGISGCAVPELLTAAAPPAKSSIDRTRVVQGAQLAAIGNCLTCHTTASGKPYAGGRALKTPFGTVYGTNITPDLDTGIGRWSEAAFARAMREGVGRTGQLLYPAFPYDHFTRLTDVDIGALYAFLMTREPVRAETPANKMRIPRPLISVWNAMFLDRGTFQADPLQSAQWNRGAYLVQGPGHCSACHTPRNALGAESKRETFSGGESEGWHAPALNARSPSPMPWTVDALYSYLRHGSADTHAVAAGPMIEVVRNLRHVSDDDVRAMAVYVASLDTRPAEERRKAGERAVAGAERQAVADKDRTAAKGAGIYAGACSSCHDRGRNAEGGALRLPLATGLTLPTPRNLIRIIRDGIFPLNGESGLWMPGYAGALTDEQLSDLVTYLRSLTSQPIWEDVPGDVHRIAQGK